MEHFLSNTHYPPFLLKSQTSLQYSLPRAGGFSLVQKKKGCEANVKMFFDLLFLQSQLERKAPLKYQTKTFFPPLLSPKAKVLLTQEGGLVNNQRRRERGEKK